MGPSGPLIPNVISCCYSAVHSGPLNVGFVVYMGTVFVNGMHVPYMKHFQMTKTKR